MTPSAAPGSVSAFAARTTRSTRRAIMKNFVTRSTPLTTPAKHVAVQSATTPSIYAAQLPRSARQAVNASAKPDVGSIPAA